MKEILLTQGKVALVDDEDYEYLNQWKWCAIKGRKTYYAVRRAYINSKYKFYYMHRIIMNTPNKLQTDHIDGNGLNCQKFNMRNCTHAQNQMNRRSGGSSKYLGVFLHRKNYFTAIISINKKAVYLGHSKDEKKAALMYNEAAIKYHGEFARLNVI
jgi:hypothetical protein